MRCILWEASLVGWLSRGILASSIHSHPSSIARSGSFCQSSTCLWSHAAIFPAGVPDLSSWHFECSLLAPPSAADPRGGHLSDGPDIPSESPAGKTIVSDNPGGFLPPPSRQPKCSKPGRNQSPSLLRIYTLFSSSLLLAMNCGKP